MEVPTPMEVLALIKVARKLQWKFQWGVS